MTMLIRSKEWTRFTKFITVGIFGALVDFGIMNILSQLFRMPLLIAGTISFVCAIISNFLWNRFWTYPDSRSRSFTNQMIMFFIVNLAGVALRLPILHFLEPPMQRFIISLDYNFPLSAEILGKNITLAIAVGVVMLWNFFTNRYWTYNDIDKDQ